MTPSTARVALDATFRRSGAAAVHSLVTAEPAGSVPLRAGQTDGLGFVRLVLPARPLPATYQLVVAGQPAGTLFLAAGALPRAHPVTGWAITVGRELETLTD